MPEFADAVTEFGWTNADKYNNFTKVLRFVGLDMWKKVLTNHYPVNGDRIDAS